MPLWLIIAISTLWVIHALWNLVGFLEYAKLSYRQRQLWNPNTAGKTVIYSFIPFTIFWWSWVIFG